MIVGLDPGIANFGVAAFDVVGGDLRIVDGGVIRTEKSSKKRGVSVAADDFHRQRVVATQLRAFLASVGAMLLVAEERSEGMRGSKAIKSMSGAWGVIAATACWMDLSVVVVSPKEIKLRVGGRSGATKGDVEGGVLRVHPRAEVIAGRISPAGAREHFFDAAAAVMCAQGSSEMIMVRRMMRAR